jgi:hypothetical protein
LTRRRPKNLLNRLLALNISTKSDRSRPARSTAPIDTRDRGVTACYDSAAMSELPHFVDEAMRQAIRARIVELYDRHGLKAFRFPGVQKAIDLLVDADALTPEQLAEVSREARRRVLQSDRP